MSESEPTEAQLLGMVRGIGYYPCLTPLHHHNIVGKRQDDGSIKMTCSFCGRTVTVGAQAGGQG